MVTVISIGQRQQNKIKNTDSTFHELYQHFELLNLIRFLDALTRFYTRAISPLFLKFNGIPSINANRKLMT